MNSITDELRPLDEQAFGARVEPHRRELHVHCYRLLGSFEEAEDLVQEAFLRAGAKGLLVEWPEFVGDGVHSVCDGGRPKNSSPAPCSISRSVAAVEGAALRRASQHDPPVRRRSDSIIVIALQVKPSVRQALPC